ncbi:MAG: c-type cytochrome [Candidatus Acidiferrales bacterium]
MQIPWKWAIFIFFLSIDVARAEANAARGAQLFSRQCTACHSVQPGEQLTGPSLSNIWNHKAGTVDGFRRYSNAMQRLDVTWDASNLDSWLGDPQRFLPGTSMAFPGIASSADRRDITAYLKAVAGHTSPQMPARSRTMVDMRAAPPEGRVTRLEYCGDTYTVTTADGKRAKIWEFNLRFKSDSSSRGPFPGKPVVIGASMRGDRAFIVFASPMEISPFVQATCR